MTDTTPTPYDYRQYDRIWQRVDPSLNPYPSVRSGNEPPSTMTAMETLPGAFPDPCCMGSAAREQLGVIEGFAQVALEDRWYYQGLLRCAPSGCRGLVRDFASEKNAQAKRLMAVYYLITGTCYEPALLCGQVKVEPWCQVLRNRYHGEACAGFNYARAADATTDPCLSGLLSALSEDTYAMARRLLLTLEKTM